MRATLLLLRHGQSLGNAEGIFTGWQDVPLTPLGLDQAARAGALLHETRLLPDVVHTSTRRRAISTANVALDACDRHWVPVRRSWRLNERHYGALQGKDKQQVLAEFGEEAFWAWRRSYQAAPPPAIDEQPAQLTTQQQTGGPGDLGGVEPPVRSEALRDVVARVIPYWEQGIVPDLRAGLLVLVAAHGNSIRALCKHLDRIGDAEIADLEIPNGIPLAYEFDAAMQVRSRAYLDPQAAEEAIRKVR